MARPATAAREAHRLQTEQWRSKLKNVGRPEACHVDVALAAAASAFVAADVAQKNVSERSKALVATAVALLTAKGFDNDETVNKVRQRILKRKDLSALQDTAVGVTRGRANV